MATQPLNDVHICNLSLGLLQQEAISSISVPVSNAEKMCANFYHSVRRSTLAGHLWNFAKTRAKLAKLTSTPAFEYSAEFLLPTDFVRLVRFGILHTDVVDYDIESGKILLNGFDSTQLPIVYISDFKIVSQMSPLFVDLFSIELAIKLAPFLKADPSEVQLLTTLRDRAAKKATGVDGQEVKPKLTHRSRMLESRKSTGTV